MGANQSTNVNGNAPAVQIPSPEPKQSSTENKPNHHPPIPQSSSFSMKSLCPVIKKEDAKLIEDKKPAPLEPATPECPVKTYKNPEVYNVYSQKIDPKNNMPSTANQLPAPDQTIPLNTNRVASSIPKAGTDNETWLYPSPQMFWNSLVRKKKTDDASEDYMDTVVAIHNNMNENTWKQVLAWEELHKAEYKDISGAEPKLLRFLGRPEDLSPKATIKMLVGNPRPFDRHDWFVDRGGKIIRYVIDYYHDEEGVKLDKKPENHLDPQALKSIKVDVRPALDSVEAIFDRIVYMPMLKFQGKSLYSPPPFFPKTQSTSTISDIEAVKREEFASRMTIIQSKCASFKSALQNCKNEVECTGASMNLSKCAASVICPDIAENFDLVVKNSANSKNAGESIDNAYGKVLECLENFNNNYKPQSK